LKFSDAIIATVSLILFGLILHAFLFVAFGSIAANMTSDVLSFIIAVLVISLIVGYVFASKIQEQSRIKAIGLIVVLSAFTMLVFISIWIANGFAYPWFKDSLNSTFNRTAWTDYDLEGYAALNVSFLVIIYMVLSFIGLYVGSMLERLLQKPKNRRKH
jgi:hypothetical protein